MSINDYENVSTPASEQILMRIEQILNETFFILINKSIDKVIFKKYLYVIRIQY